MRRSNDRSVPELVLPTLQIPVAPVERLRAVRILHAMRSRGARQGARRHRAGAGALLVDSERFGRRWLPKSAAMIENGELRMRGWLYRKLTEPAKEAA
jgi:glutamate synthase domain-containing protein 1